jgi:hypothetical protein
MNRKKRLLLKVVCNLEKYYHVLFPIG